MKLGANDKFFLLLSYHGKAAVMQYAFKLTEKVDPDALKKAAAPAVKAFPLFGLRPVVTADGKLIMEEDSEEIIVSPDDGKIVYLGSSDTNGYLFRITYKEYTVKVVASHAIGDGRSILSFTLTLLYYYFVTTGKKIDPEGMLYTVEDKNDPTLTDNLIARLHEINASDSSEEAVPLEHLFYAPEEKKYMGTQYTKRLVLSFDQSKFIKTVKEKGTTPLIYMHDLITRTMYEYYGLTDKTIIAYVPVDLREKLCSRSQANFTYNVDLALDEKLLAVPENERYKKLKAKLSDLSRIENIAAIVDAASPMYDALDSMSLNDIDQFQESIDLTKATRSYLLSNIGMIRMPDDMRRYVADAAIYFSAVEASPVYTMLTFGNKGMMVIGQNFEETGLLEALREKLSELGIDNKLDDQGLLRMDDLDIRRFKHL